MATGAKCISRHEYPRGPCTQRSSPLLHLMVGFPGGSGGKESACNAGDLGSVPGLGRSLGEGHGNPLQCSCLENPWTEEPGGLHTVHGVTKSWMQPKRLSTRLVILISHVSYLEKHWSNFIFLISLFLCVYITAQY